MAFLIAFGIIIIIYIPWIVFDLQHNFANIHGIIDLVTGGNEESLGWPGIIKITFNKFYDFYHQSLLQGKLDILFLIVLASSIAVIFYNLINALKKKKNNISSVILLLWLFIPFVVFFFYRDYTPPHYFCVVFPLSFMLVGGLTHFLSKKKWLRTIALVMPLFMGSILLFYSVIFLSDLNINGSRTTTYEVTLQEMQKVIKYIDSQETDKKVNFISQPSRLLGRGYEYLLDQDDFSIVSKDEEFMYLATYGNNLDIDSLIQDGELVDWQRYGQAVILKIKKHPTSTEDVL